MRVMLICSYNQFFVLLSTSISSILYNLKSRLPTLWMYSYVCCSTRLSFFFFFFFYCKKIFIKYSEF